MHDTFPSTIHLNLRVNCPNPNKCVQIHDGNIESMIVNWFLHILDHHQNVQLQFGCECLPHQIEIQTVGHIRIAIGGQFSKIAKEEQIQHSNGGQAKNEKYFVVKIMDLLQNEDTNRCEKSTKRQSVCQMTKCTSHYQIQIKYANGHYDHAAGQLDHKNRTVDIDGIQKPTKPRSKHSGRRYFAKKFGNKMHTKLTL